MHKRAAHNSSLCKLGVLCVSVVSLAASSNQRDTEDTEMEHEVLGSVVQLVEYLLRSHVACRFLLTVV